jgi:hypothetical protein
MALMAAYQLEHEKRKLFIHLIHECVACQNYSDRQAITSGSSGTFD